jgi:hypothetical protein
MESPDVEVGLKKSGTWVVVGAQQPGVNQERLRKRVFEAAVVVSQATEGRSGLADSNDRVCDSSIGDATSMDDRTTMPASRRR